MRALRLRVRSGRGRVSRASRCSARSRSRGRSRSPGGRSCPCPVDHGRRAGRRLPDRRASPTCSDVKRIDAPSLALLRDLDVLVAQRPARRAAPRRTRRSPRRWRVIAELAPRRAFLTHLDHELRHAALAARLPAGVEVADRRARAAHRALEERTMADLPTVVCFGDSNTHGFDGAMLRAGFPRSSAGPGSWPELAGRRPRRRGGPSGRTTSGIDPFTRRASNGRTNLLDVPAVARTVVAVVVIMLGTNDLKTFYRLRARRDRRRQPAASIDLRPVEGTGRARPGSHARTYCSWPAATREPHDLGAAGLRAGRDDGATRSRRSTARSAGPAGGRPSSTRARWSTDPRTASASTRSRTRRSAGSAAVAGPVMAGSHRAGPGSARPA